jgi:hypothetical protein
LHSQFLFELKWESVLLRFPGWHRVASDPDGRECFVHSVVLNSWGIVRLSTSPETSRQVPSNFANSSLAALSLAS